MRVADLDVDGAASVSGDLGMMLAAFLGAGGVMGAIQAFFRAQPERDQILVTSAKDVVVIQRDTISDLTGRLETLEARVEELTTTEERLRRERDKLRDENTALRGRVASLEEQVTQLAEELRSRRGPSDT